MYSVFVNVMDFLSGIFGYEGALKVKDGGDAFIAFALGGFLSLYLMSQFYLQVDVDPELRSDIALQRLSTTPPGFTANPENFTEMTESFLAFILMKFSKKKTMRFRKMHNLLIYIRVIVLVLLLFGVLLSSFEYLPPIKP